MNTLTKKIDFTCIISVNDANPNGDPLYENRPRQRLNGKGEITDVCLKRKIRNALSIVLGQNILLQSNGLELDKHRSMKERLEAIKNYKKITTEDERIKLITKEFFDVRAFGQVIAMKGDKLSVGIRGPVTIRPAVSVEPVICKDIQITKSLNSVPGGKGSDTIGMKYVVEHGIYIFHGSISPQLAQLTGFSDGDAEILKESILSMFEIDSSAARPAGSMTVESLLWWETKGMLSKVNTSELHESVKVIAKTNMPSSINDYNFILEEVKTNEDKIFKPTIYGKIKFD